MILLVVATASPVSLVFVGVVRQRANKKTRSAGFFVWYHWYMAKALVVGNWKSYVTTFNEAKKLFKDIEKALPKRMSADVVVCPPFPFIDYLADSYSGERIAFGAQDAHFEVGAATGTVSVPALKSVGARYIIVGHAERRAAGDTDDIVAKKVGAVLDEKLTPIVCVGEKERDKDGHYLKALEKSVEASLAQVQERDMKKVVIAYEPVWAIGAALPPEARTIRETIIFIRKILANMFGREVALKARIIYGGAVDDGNAHELMANSGTGGFLLGRASVDAEKFSAIVSMFQ